MFFKDRCLQVSCSAISFSLTAAADWLGVTSRLALTAMHMQDICQEVHSYVPQRAGHGPSLPTKRTHQDLDTHAQPRSRTAAQPNPAAALRAQQPEAGARAPKAAAARGRQPRKVTPPAKAADRAAHMVKPAIVDLASGSSEPASPALPSPADLQVSPCSCCTECGSFDRP